MSETGGRDPDSLEILTARAIVMQSVEEARVHGHFHGCFHDFEVDSSSWLAHRAGRTARMTRVVVRLGGRILGQQMLVEGLDQKLKEVVQ